jgi:hypothetical protein
MNSDKRTYKPKSKNVEKLRVFLLKREDKLNINKKIKDEL